MDSLSPSTSLASSPFGRATALLLIVIGLGLQLWLWQRGRLLLNETSDGRVELCGTAKYDRDSFTRDQVHLLTPAAERYAGGDLLPYSKRMSGGGIVPGSLLQILIGEPLKIHLDYRSASMVILLFHVGAAALLFFVALEASGPAFAALYLLLFWFSPWRAYHSGFLWEPAYMLLPAAVHLWGHWKSRAEPLVAPSFLLAVALSVAPQIHGSAMVLLLISAGLLLRRQWRPNVPAFGLGLGIGVLPLLPTVLAWSAGTLDLVDEDDGTTTDRGPLRWLYRIPRALAYWIRLGSMDVGRRYRQTAFYDSSELLLQAGAVAIVTVAVVSALVVAYISWLWMRDRLPGLPRDSFLHAYSATAFFAVLLSAVISPVTLQGWHVLIALPAALIPVTSWLLPRLRGNRGRSLQWLVPLALLAGCLLLGLGHPMYAEPPMDGPCRLLDPALSPP